MVAQLLMFARKSTGAACTGVTRPLGRFAAPVGRFLGPTGRAPLAARAPMEGAGKLGDAWPWWAQEPDPKGQGRAVTDQPYWVAAPGGPWGAC